MYVETNTPVNQKSARIDMLFKPSNWLAKIDFIKHLVLLNNVLMAVFAELGGGKTTFIELLRAELDTNITSHVIDATEAFTTAVFLNESSNAFDLPAVATIADFVAGINEKKINILIIIDNAQHLSDVFLEEVLSEIKKYANHNFFHLCLVSDFKLAAPLGVLDTAESFKNLIHTIQLGPLNESETKTYLLKKLSPCKRIDKLMSDKRVKAFYQLTGGNVECINKQMANYFNPQSLSDSKFKRMGLAASFIVALAATTYIWQADLFSLRKIAVNEQPVEHKLAENPLPLISQIPPLAVAATREWVLPSSMQEVLNYNKNKNNDEADDEANDEDENISNLVLMDRVVVIPKIMHHEDKKQALTSSFAPIDEQATLESSLVAIADSIADSIKPAIISLPVSPAVSPQAKIHHDQIKLAASLAKQKSAATSAPVSTRYTVQLLASLNPDDLKRYISTHHVGKTAKIHLHKRQGVNWYVLTLGEYSDRDEALAAMRKLPAKLTQSNPWIRSVNGLTALS